jgi:creatinine amidohydrolase
MALFPGGDDWGRARRDSDCKTSQHEDMHAGELEASLLMHGAPHLVRPGFAESDHEADDHPDLLVLGMAAYTENGVIGRLSLGTTDKGALILESLSASFARLLDVLSPPK